jgi:hypothetical protein
MALVLSAEQKRLMKGVSRIICIRNSMAHKASYEFMKVLLTHADAGNPPGIIDRRMSDFDSHRFTLIHAFDFDCGLIKPCASGRLNSLRKQMQDGTWFCSIALLLAPVR